jgi:hypothetical protein
MDEAPRRLRWVIGMPLGVVALLFLLTTAAPALADTAAVVAPAPGLASLNPDWKTDQMVVQVWPEYDERAVLVFMNFSLPADVQLPATLKFAVPKGAVISGIGEVDENGNFTFNYKDSYPPVESGTDWDIATIQVQKYRALQIDYYYDPGLPTGAGARSYPVLMQLPLDAGSLNLHVQEPARATDFNVQPAMQGSGQASDGFTYFTATFTDVKAGSTLGYVVSYSKPDGDPSTTSSKPSAAKLSTNTVLLAAVLVVVVCIGALVIYRLYRNTGKAARTAGKRERPNTRSGPAEPRATTKKKRPAAERPAAGAQSGSTEQATPSRRFCFACGEELTKKARFCPSCGESQDD